MIIVFDTTVLNSNPQLNASWWNDFVDEARERGDKLVVPHAVVIEAVAHYARDVTEAIEALDGWAKSHNRYGLEDVRDAARTMLRQRVEGQEYALRRYLKASGVEIVDPPPVDHLDLVRRAVMFRKPYDADARKDGYRDTLHWLTVLHIARENPTEQVWWLSQNQKDFGDGNGKSAGWHPEIADELKEQGLSGRVHYDFNIPSLRGTLAELTAPLPESDWATIVSGDTVADTMTASIAGAWLGRAVPAEDVALSSNAKIPTVSSLSKLKDLEWSDIARSGRAGYFGRFTAKTRANFDVAFHTDSGTEFSVIEKDILLSGLATFTGPGEVESVSILEFVAPPDDPAFAALEWLQLLELISDRDRRSQRAEKKKVMLQGRPIADYHGAASAEFDQDKMHEAISLLKKMVSEGGLSNSELAALNNALSRAGLSRLF
ncbi:PIN domain-containing protein [Rhodococcus sp. (in: high G+C Gram-positive bacteria)]|uniref:PIN domain-containing protein n=1 Tax=Rhodococcus sp. TaxID=1831 RepID=UPI00257D2543|nr:PIN domain-containing protein [Rhodococcus sp. (in: high G+C Gram-positive bacteria)]MBQ7806351.1 DUF4935 domain-containing protein [Rhodococcus sp. (in: high G+C Gram-positive bacteria)]